MSTRPAPSPAAKPAPAIARRAAARQRALQRRRPRVSRLLAWLLAAWLGHAGLSFAQVAPGALPSGGQVMVGSGQLQLSPNLLVIQQNSNRLGLDWQSFNIGSSATVEFRQPGASAVALNRVVGNSGSEIYGNLKANGQVFLTNPNGVLFAPGSKVDVGGLVASTFDLSQQDFADGRYVFNATGAQGRVLNQGSLNASAGGYLALFGQHVDNQGDIAVNAGSVVLASGRAATVSISGSGLISAVVSSGTLPGSVDNSGRITADGGTVTLSAKSAQDIAASLVNNSGIVRANTLVEKAGEIWITGDHVANRGQLVASAPDGGDAGRVMVIGNLLSGRADVGGTIDASAASGKGGFVETSAATVTVAGDARVVTKAVGGQPGTWLIDPNDFTIAASGGNITGATLSTNLGGGSVTIATANMGTAGGNGDIFVNDAVSWAANTLTLSAERNIAINAAMAGSGTARLALEYGQGAVAAGNTSSYSVNVPVSLAAGVGNLTTRLGTTGGTTVSYTVVTDLAGLQLIDGNATALATSYALGAALDASASATANSGLGFNPIGNEAATAASTTNSFSGQFEGLGNTISGLTIARPTALAVGLFGNTNNAQIRNLTLTGSAITGSQYAGGVVGFANAATALNKVQSSGAVATASASTAYAGGLVGQFATTGTVTQSITAGTVTGRSSVGGLVGYGGTGAVANSSSSANVTATAGDAGGLMGRAGGAVSNSSASGTVSGTSDVGGLIGIANGTGAVTGSSATGRVTNTLTTGSAGGLIGTMSSGAVTGGTASGAVSGGTSTGGLIGNFSSSTAGITNSSATGNVTGSAGGDTGGLVGIATGTGSLSDSSATGSVSAPTNGDTVGGLAGQFSMTGGIVNSSAGAAASGPNAATTVSGGVYTGGVVGWYNSATALVNDASNTIAFRGATVTGSTWVGGVVGYMSSTAALTITGPAAGTPLATQVIATGTSGSAGVLAGRTNGVVSGFTASGTVSSAGTAGGLVGTADGAGGFNNVSASGTVTGTGTGGAVGGLVGSYSNSGALTGTPGVTTASGAVQGGSGSGAITGGLVGVFNSAGGIVNASTATTSTVAGGGDTGGLVGDATGTGASAITGSTARGNVTGGNNVGKVGGLVGDFNMAGGWSNVTAAGTVSGGNYAGGLAGDYRSAAAITGGSFTGGTVSGGTWVGGLFGAVSTAAITGPSAGSPMTVAVTVTSAGNAGGLAGYTGGAVTNVTATGNVTSTGTGTFYVGGLIGQADGTGGVTDVSASGTVTTATLAGSVGGLIGYNNIGGVLRGASTGNVSGGRYTGGLVGYFDAGAASIQNGAASGNVSGFGDTGGLVGFATGTGSISNSSAGGTVTSSATATYSVGGVAGYFALSGGVAGTTTAGNVTGGAQTGGYIGYYSTATALSGVSTPSSVTTVTGTTWVGGVVGYVNAAASLSGLSSSANVTATGTGGGAAGGVVGRSNGSVATSSASGNVSGRYTVGGLIGQADGTGTLTDSSASGAVSSDTAAAWIGGLVGRYSLSGAIGGTITATGVVAGGSSAGGIVGYYNSTAPVAGLTRGTASVTGQDWVGGVIGYSEASSISGSSSAASVTATGTSYAAGGLVGRSGGAVSSSSATGSVTAGNDAGGLIGNAAGTGALTDLTASGNVSSSGVSAAVGGLIGSATSGAITGGTASGTVSGGNQTGGLVGSYSVNASITSSEATGSVNGRGAVGGLVGYASGSGGIVDGTARGSVTGVMNTGAVGGLVGEFRKAGGITRGNAYGNVSGGTRAGGLTGYHISGGNIANSNAYGDTVTAGSYGGGLVGEFTSSGDITNSTARSVVTATDYAGGLVGSLQSSNSVTDSRATGRVSGTTYVGGLIGYAYNSAGGINNSSATGNVDGTYMVGGLVGQLAYTSLSRGTASGRVAVVSDSTVYVGGLVGYTYGTSSTNSIADSTATGAVNVDASYVYAGGLAGQVSSVAISNGNASGSVTVKDSRNLNSSSLFAGGLVGYYSASSSVGISASRATGDVSGAYYGGGLAGYYDGNSNAASISDSSASGKVTATYYGGGLVGSLRNVGVRNGQATGDVVVTSTGGRAGGLVGEALVSYDGTSINDSAATGNVSGGSYAGGLIGYFQNQLYNTGTAGVTNNRASGNVSNTAVAGGLVGGYSAYYYGIGTVDLGIRNGQASGNVSASQIAGGLVGDFDGFAGIRDSSATGSVTGTSGTSTRQLGGLVGRFINRNTTAGAGVLSSSYATGTVALASGVTMNTNTTVYAGGLVGQLDGTSAAAVTLSDSYATGNVTLASTNGRLNAGGLVGQANTSLDNVYATGAVSATGGTTRTVGGLVAARNATAVTATDSYWATDTSGQAASIIGSARTLAQLQTAANFNGWDIASSSGSGSIWRIYEGFTTPLLRGFLTPLALTLVDVSKTYDGTTSLGGATVNSSGGAVQFPDRIRVGGSGVAADVGSYALGAANLYSVQNGYDLNLVGTAQLTVNKKALTLAGLAASKTYDATTAAAVAAGGQPGGLVAGEDLLFQPAGNFGLAFADKNAGVAKTVNIAGSYTWADGTRGKVGNYTLPTGTTTTADITKATLTAGSFSATNRAYDGTTAVAVTATPATLSGVLGTDGVSVDLSSVSSGTVADKNVGTGKAVTVLGASLTGTDAGNYTLAGIGSAVVNITPRAVTVNGITATNRAYNRLTNVSINTNTMSLSGVLGSDQVTPSSYSVSASVADKNVGDAKPVTVTGLTLRGVDAANYAPQQGAVSVNITPFLVTVYAQPTTGTSRVYNGTADATVALYNDWTYSLSNLWAGDNVTLSNTGIAYDNKNVAYNTAGAVTSKTITVSGLSLSGTDAGNYTLQNTTTTTTGTITPLALPVSGISATNRVYNGSRDVQINVSSAVVDTSVVVPGDNVSVVIPTAGSVTGQMVDKNVGTGKAVTVPGLTITGADAGNYTVNSASNGVSVDITRKDLNVAYTASDKVYDGGRTVVTQASSSDVVSGDELLFYSNFYTTYYYGYNPWASFSDKNVGTGKTVSSSTESIYGNDANNYNLINPNGAIATASISAKPVTLDFSGVTKVYDGLTTATVTLNRNASGVYSGDTITTSQSAEYTGTNAKNVGTGKAISVTGITFTGNDASNYTVSNTSATTTGNVTAKPVTLSGITAVDRAYDGTTTVQVNAATVTSAGFVTNDIVSVAQPSGGLTSGTIANRNVGTAKPVTVTGLSLTGTDAVNYSIDLAGSGITVNIGQKALTPTYTGVSRVYNGGVTAGVTSTTAGIETGDTVTFSQQAVFSGGGARNVGTAKPIGITSIALGGASAANYSLTATTATATADITPKSVTADYVGVNRVYNGLADTSISVLGSSLQVLAGDFVNFTQTASLVGDGAAGSNRSVSVSNIALTGQDGANYTLLNTTASTTVNITRRPLGVAGITATSRVYDGTTNVAVNVSGATVDVSTKVAGDDVSVTLPPNGISTGTMADRHVGNAKPVAITGLAISGTSAANYSLIGATGLNVNITPAAITATYTGADKVYNGNTTALVTGTSADIFAVDAGSVQINATGTFTGTGAKNVGTGKTVAVRDGFLGGAQRDNYTLLNATGSTTASITARPVTASYASGLSKVYDGGVSAPASGSIVNVVAGDAVSLTQTAAFTGSGARNVGNGKAIDVTGITLTGADAGNYTLGTSSTSTVGNITPKSITVGGLSNVTAADRVYDGTRTVVVTVPTGVTLVPSSADIVAGDVVNIEVPVSGVTTGSVATKSVGAGKAVTVDGLSLSGTDGGNYRIGGTAGITVSITPKTLTANYVGVSRAYDGTVNASVTGTSTDIIGGDIVNIGGSGVFSDAGGKNVGSGKTISVLQAQLSGNDGANYSLVNTTGSTTGSITQRSVTAVYSSPGRVYDGGTLAPVSGSAGFIFGDQVSLAQTAVFTGANARNVGEGKAIQVSSITLNGSDAANYALTATSASTQGSIRPRPIGILGLTGVSAQDRAYDGSTAVTVDVQSTGTISVNTADIVAGDNVTVTVPSTGTTTGVVANKNVGTAKPVTVTGLALTGPDAPNYTISAATGVTVNITPKALTASFAELTRVYDGTTDAVVTGSSSGVVSGDVLTISATGVFTGTGAKNVGTGKPVNVLSATLAGGDAPNYSLVNPTGTTTGSITPRGISVAYVGGTRVYDGGVNAPVTGTAAGFIAGDDLSLTQTAQFTGAGAKNVGAGKAVSITGVTLGGGDAGNYALLSNTTTTTASITPRPLRIEGFTGVVATDRVYDGSTAVAISIQGSGAIAPNQADVVAGDDVSVVAPPTGAGAGTMADKHVGSNKPVTVSGLTLNGNDAGNYSVAAATGVTVNITPLALTAVYTGQNKVYDGTAAALLLGSSANLLGGDVVSITGSGIFTGANAKNVGLGKAITVTGGALAGADARNYSLHNTTGSTSADITPRPLTPSYVGGTRVYDGTTDAPVTLGSSGAIAGDDLRIAQSAVFGGIGARNVGVDKPVVVSGITLQGADAVNYALTSTSASTTATVTPRPLNISGLSGLQAVNRVYDGTRDVQVTGSAVIGTATGDVLAGDDVTISLPSGSISAGTMVDKSAGTGKSVAVSGLSLSGADAVNYQITGVAGLTVNIAPRPVVLLGVSAVNRVYDGSTVVAINSAGGSLNGVLAGDDLRLLASGVTGSMADRHAGSGKAVNVTGLSLAGADVANYTVDNSGGLRVDITPRTLVASAIALDKVYDGNNTAAVTLQDDRIAGDALSLTRSSATFAGKDAGAGQAVSVAGLSLGGADAGDYVLLANTLSTTASINRAPLTVQANSLSKVYGESINLTGAEYTTLGLVAGESLGAVTLASAGTAATAAVAGSPYAVAASDARGGTFNPANYTLTYSSGLLTVTPRPLTIAANSVVRSADEANPATFGFSTNVGGLVGGDSIASVVLNAPTGSATAAGGSIFELVPRGAVFGVGQASNYALSYDSGLLVVLPKPPRVDDVDPNAGNSGPQGFAVQVDQAELERALDALQRNASVVAQAGADTAPGLPLALRNVDATAAEISVALAGDSRRITLPALLRLPLVSFDPTLRRLMFGGPAAGSTPPSSTAP